MQAWQRKVRVCPAVSWARAAALGKKQTLRRRINSGQVECSAGQRDTVVKIGTLPPDSGQLTARLYVTWLWSAVVTSSGLDHFFGRREGVGECRRGRCNVVKRNPYSDLAQALSREIQKPSCTE